MPKITKDIEDNKVTYKLECPDTIHLITAPNYRMDNCNKK